MPLDSWLGVTGTIALVVLAPGPSVTLVWVQRARHGPRATWPTIAGDLTANMLQLAVAWLGVARLLAVGVAGRVLGSAGVAYLCYLAVRQLWPVAGAATAVAASSPPASAIHSRAFFARGFMVSAANPKAIVFFMGLLAPTIAEARGSLVSLAILAGTFAAMDGSALVLYAYGGGRMRAWLARQGRLVWERRIAGALLLAAAMMLATRI